MYYYEVHSDKDVRLAINSAITVKAHNDVELTLIGNAPKWANRYFDLVNESVKGLKQIPCNSLCIAPFDKLTKKYVYELKEGGIQKSKDKSLIIFTDLSHPNLNRYYQKIVKDARSNR